MRGALVFLCLVLGATALPRSSQDDYREETQRIRLNQLKDTLSNLKSDLNSKLETAKKVSNKIDELKEAVRQAEDSGCDDRTQFQCGGDMPKCISRLLVCDSKNDCPNGADETDQCRVYTPAGSIWQGTVDFDYCTKRKPKEVRLTIDSYIIYDYLRSFPAVTATLDFDPNSYDFDKSNSIKLSGSMDLMVGNNILYFGAPEQDGLAFQCVFDGRNDYQCQGDILYESSQRSCAQFTLERKDSYAAQ